MSFRLRFTTAVVGALGATALLAAQGQPVPRPFPGAPGTTSTPPPPPATPAGTPAPQTPAVRPAAPTAQSSAPSDALFGIPGIISPGLTFLESFDAGRGQRAYLFGTNASFLEVTAYYKQLLKDGGRELFKAPAMQQYDIGKFQEQTMAYPPSVVVKDYAFGGADGYLHVSGTKDQRFKTVVQIVK